MTVSSPTTALMTGRQAYFAGQGGIAPYTYSVLPGGAGGTINSITGLYTAPSTVPVDPAKSSDTIQAVDSAGTPETATKKILVTDAVGLVCEIIQRGMSLESGRVYFWDQKIMQPKDDGIYIAVSVVDCKPFANTNRYESSDAGMDSIQSVNMKATLGIDIISRSMAAFRRKEEVLMALNSIYSEQQQERNSFYIGKLPPGTRFINLSNIDGAAIPYRYNISINIQYFVEKISPVDYFDDFEDVEIETES